jgi:hypothetical protein
MRFAIASVPATNVSEDGQTIMLRVQTAQREHVDLEASYTILEDVANALNEASARAHRARRKGRTVDESVSLGDAPLSVLAGYRFGVADDKSGLLLSLQTSIGRTDILLPGDKAAEFVAEANQHIVLLQTPSRTN